MKNNGDKFELSNGSVVIAAITSCTNTSNPSLMLGAGLLAKKAVERGLHSKPWVKTSLAPGSKVVTDYLDAAGLSKYLDHLGFQLVGYGCTTCIGNSGPLEEHIGAAIKDNSLVAVSVLSGNRNFEGRIHPLVRANYLASPPLVVAYALAGRMDFDMASEPLGNDKDGKPVFLRDIWPSPQEIESTVRASVTTAMYHKEYGEVFKGDATWRGLKIPEGDLYAWSDKSTYIKNPPFFDKISKTPAPLTDIRSARALAMLGNSITTDHISPAGSIGVDSPAGKWLIAQGVKPADFNSYGARRGNHEVMMRGTFANIRLRNQLAPGTEGGWTVHQPDGEKMSIYDAVDEISEGKRAADRSRRQGIRLGIVARLGGEGHGAARRARGDRGKLRAHPPQQPARHGRAAAAISGGRIGAIARPHRIRGIHHRRRRETLSRADRRSAREGQDGKEKFFKRSRAPIRPRKSTITVTGAFCRTCCGKCCRIAG